MRRAVCALLASLLLLTFPNSAFARWTRIMSDHFVVIGDGSEREIRDVAERVELFRQVMGQVLSEEAVGSPVPTVVVVFRNDRAFTPFKPLFNGKPIALAGYFTSGDGPNYIALNAEQDSDAYGVIFHEYAHFLVGNAIGTVPLWINEGLAGFYQTFQLGNGGKSAILGSPNREHLGLLKQSRPMPLAQLIAADSSSPMYNEGDRRGLFYAQSWALVHYLRFADPKRNAQLTEYLGSIRAGTPAAAAFPQAFGETAALERELAEYVRRERFATQVLAFDDKLVQRRTSGAEVIPDYEAAGYLGELLERTDAERARAYLESVIAESPDAGRALGVLGMLELRAGNVVEARGLLERAATLAPGMASVQGAYGRALIRSADGQSADSNALFARAREVLTRAHLLEPDNVATAADLAYVEMNTAGGASRATALLQRAVTLAPGREDLRLMLADALILEGNDDAAAMYLGALVGRGSTPEIREKARAGLAQIATAKRAADPPPDRAEADTAVSARAAASPESPEPPRPSMPEGAYLPVFRSVKAGETRVLGTFESVACQQGRVVIEIETEDGPVQMVTKALGDVEFLTYRPDAPSEVACGAQRPAFRVLATFLEAPDGAAGAPNRAVAIELLPEDYVPR